MFMCARFYLYTKKNSGFGHFLKQKGYALGEILPLFRFCQIQECMKKYLFIIFCFFAFSLAAQSAPTHIWTGATDTNWSTPGNWTASPASAPGVNSIVKIPSGLSNYPVLQANASAKEIEIESGAILDLASFVVNTTGGATAKVKNAGTLKMEGTLSQKGWLKESGKILHSNTSTIHYNGSGAGEVWAGPYKNLTIERSINIGTIDNTLVVNGKFEVLAGSGTISVTAKSQEYKGDAILGRETEFVAETKAKFKKIGAGANNVKFNCVALDIEEEIEAEDISINKAGCVANTKDINANKLSLLQNGIVWTSNGEVEVQNDIVFSGNNIKWNSNGDVSVQNDITVSVGKIEWTSVGNIIVQSNINLAGTTSKWTSSANVTVQGDIVARAAEWKATSGTIEVWVNVDAPKFEQEAGKFILSGTGAQSVKVKKLKELEVGANSDATMESIAPLQQTIEKTTNRGKLKLASGAKVSINEIENTGTFTSHASEFTLKHSLTNASGNFSADKLKLEHGSDPITIEGGTGNTNLGDVECTGAGGKTVVFKKDITIGTGSKLSGTSKTSLLTLEGEGTIHLTASPTQKAKWVQVKTDLEVQGAVYKTEESQPIGTQSDIDAGKPTGWAFESCLILKLKWKSGGTPANQWTLDENWAPRCVPTDVNEVVIPSGLSNYPVLQANASAKEIEIESGAILDLASFVVNTTGGATAKVKNAGTLKMEGTLSQKGWLKESGKILHSNTSTIHYNGSGAGEVWAGPYKNLTIERSINIGTIDNTLVVNGKFEVLAGSGTISVTAKSQEYKGDAILGRETEFVAETKAKFKKIGAGANNVKFNCVALDIEEEIEAEDISINKAGCVANTKDINANKLSLLQNGIVWTSNGEVEVQNDIVFSGNNIKWNSNGDVSVQNDITVSVGKIEWTSVGNIIVQSNINLAGTTSKWTSSANVTVQGDIVARAAEWKATSGTIEVWVNVDAPKFEQEAGKFILSGTGAQSVKVKKLKELEVGANSDATMESIAPLQQTIEKTTNRGKLKLASGAKVSINEIENTGTFTSHASEFTLKHSLTNASGNFSADKLKLEHGSDPITIEGGTGNTNLGDVECMGAGGKTVVFKKDITIGTGSKLSGSSTTSLLTLKGEGNDSKLHLSGEPATPARYVQVETNLPVDGGPYRTKQSKPFGDGANDPNKPESWIFDDSTKIMSWTGTQNNSWMDNRNWNPIGEPEENTEVVIPHVSTNYPTLTVSDNAKAKSVKLENGAELNLSNYLIKVGTTPSDTSKLETHGTLKMVGTNEQRAWFENSDANKKISIEEGSTVEYSGTSTDAIFAGPYQNLNTSRSLSASSITVEKEFNINGTSTIEINAASQEYKDDSTFSVATKFVASTEAKFNKIEAVGNDIEFECAKLGVTGGLKARDITFSRAGCIASTNTMEARNITFSASGEKWTSGGNIKVSGDIMAQTVDWKATAGTIEVGGNIDAPMLVQEAGKVLLNGSATQNLKAKKLDTLEIDNSSGGNVILTLDEVASLLLKNRNVTMMKDATITKEFKNEHGSFDATAHSAIINLQPQNTLKIEGKANINNDSATTANTGTKFYKLHCRASGGKTLIFEGAIEILNDISITLGSGFVPSTQEGFSQDDETLILEGNSISSKLNIQGDGQIWFNETPPFPKPKKGGKFLHVAPNVQIRGGCYRVADSTHDDVLPRNWVFEEYAKIIASLAITNTHEVCIFFNTAVNKPPANSLKITSPSFSALTSTGVTACAGNNENEKNDRWMYQFSQKFTPQLLLEPNSVLTMGNSSLDFIFESAFSDLYPYKRGYISDIGLNLLQEIFAKNTKTITVFDGSKKLPFINTSVSATIPIDSLPITLSARPLSSAKYWVPKKVSTPLTSKMAIDDGPPLLQFAPDGRASTADQKVFIVPTSTQEMKNIEGLEFMFCYGGLPCALLSDEKDMFSYSLWKFTFLKTALQRGGVSIFNNVINPTMSEEATIEITTKKAGMLVIQVMTIDGSRVKTIVDEYKGAGNYSYRWGGFNTAGGMVAPGIYFVRIVANGIDEIRKVLVVR